MDTTRVSTKGDVGGPLDDLIAFSMGAAAAGLLVSTCGNASLRASHGQMLISCSGSELGCLQPEQICRIRLRDGALRLGPRSSTETELHRQVFLHRPQVGAILHWQSPWATLAACMKVPPPLGHIPEFWAYVGHYAWVPYARPGSDTLVASALAALEDTQVTVLQLRNHGQLAVGRTYKDVLRRAVFFERSCWLALQGPTLDLIPAEEAALLRDYGQDGAVC